jgi:hypothetical protein
MLRRGFAGVVALVALVVPAPASADYVALGDSYAAGPLIPLQIQPFGCLKSNNNYAHIAQRALAFAEFRDPSCSGAETEDMTQPQGVTPGPNPPQFDSLQPDTELVTINIGGKSQGLLLLDATSLEELSATSLPAQPVGPLATDCRPGGGSIGQVRSGLKLLNHEHRREQLADLVAPLRKALGVLGNRGALATATAFEELFGQGFDGVPIGSGCGHRGVRLCSVRDAFRNVCPAVAANTDRLRA